MRREPRGLTKKPGMEPKRRRRRMLGQLQLILFLAEMQSRRKEGMDGGGGAGAARGSCGLGSVTGGEEGRVSCDAPARRSNPGSLGRPPLAKGNPRPRPDGVGSREDGAVARLF